MVLEPPRAVVEAEAPHAQCRPSSSAFESTEETQALDCVSSSFRSASSSPFRVVMGMDRIERRMFKWQTY